MSTRKDTANYFASVSLGASTVLATTRDFSIGPAGNVALQVLIDDGAGATPTDAPIGAWELYATGDGERFSPVTYPALTSELARVAPNGNNVVEAWAIISGAPGSAGKLRYVRSSGGGANARATVHLSTW